MSKTLSPVVSPFSTEEQAEHHDRWFRTQVQASLDDKRPLVPHDEVMDDMRGLLNKKQARKDAG